VHNQEHNQLVKYKGVNCQKVSDSTDSGNYCYGEVIEVAGLATNLQVLPDLHTSVAVVRYPLPKFDAQLYRMCRWGTALLGNTWNKFVRLSI
jgi:hypothetical protein